MNYNMSVKVRGDVMNYTEKLKKLICEKDGFIITSDLAEHNIPRQLLRRFVEMGLLEKVDRGAYISPETFDDEMYRLQARFKPIIYSHDTALYFHNLIDRDPIEYTVTVYSGYQTTKLKKMGINTFSIKKDLFELGLSEGKTIFGRLIRMYDAERAICDCIRSRSKMDVAIITDALKRYVKNENKNIPKLMRYAEVFKIASIVKGYLEVLL